MFSQILAKAGNACRRQTLTFCGSLFYFCLTCECKFILKLALGCCKQRHRAGLRQLVGGPEKRVGADLAADVVWQAERRCQGRGRHQSFRRRTAGKDSHRRESFDLQRTLVGFSLTLRWNTKTFFLVVIFRV